MTEDLTNVIKPILTLEDVRVMGWAAALQKAHEAYPEVQWNWRSFRITKEGGAGYTACAAALLGYALGRPNAYSDGKICMSNISLATCHANSFCEAIEMAAEAERAGRIPLP